MSRAVAQAVDSGGASIEHAEPASEQPSHPPVRSRDSSRFFVRLSGNLPLRRGVISIVAGFALWEVAARWIVDNPLFFPPISRIVVRGWELVGDGTMWPHMTASGKAYVLGLGLSAVVGLFVGVLMSASRRVADFLDPWVSILNATPIVALAPLLILIFGLGISSKVAVVFMITVIPIILNARTGMSGTDKNLIETARAFGATQIQIYRDVKFPSAVPSIITGFRLAGAYGFIGIVVGELFGAQAGIGLFIRHSAERFDTPALFVGIGVLGLGGVIVTYGLLWFEHHVAPWRQSEST